MRSASDTQGPVSHPSRENERSPLVNEETVYFIFQLDLDTQLQRCLNYEAYELAQEVRKKREKVRTACMFAMNAHARTT